MSGHISTLPSEIVQNILEYLDLRDRKSASLVCRQWNQEAFSRRLQSSVQLRFGLLDANGRLLKVLRSSSRSYRNLYIKLGDPRSSGFEFVEVILNAVGSEELERLTICERCSWIQLEELISKLPKLKHLKAYVWHADVFRKRNDTNSTKFEGLTKLLSLNINIGMNITDIPQLQFRELQVLRITTSCNNVKLYNLFHHVLPLKELILHSEISQSLLETICRTCPLLETLHMCPTGLKKGSFQWLEKLTKLKVIALHYFRFVMIEDCKPVPSVEELQLLVSELDINEHNVDQLYNFFPNLRTTELSFPTFEFNAANQFLVHQICRQFPHMKKLVLIGRVSLLFHTNGCDLPYDLGNVEDLTLRYFNICLKPHPSSKVKRLRLEFLDFTRSDFSQIAECFPNLQYLELREYDYLSQGLIAEIQRKLPGCEIKYEWDTKPQL